MSDMAIEWGDQRLVVLQGKPSGGSISAKRAAVLSWPEGVDPTNAPDAAAEWLKGELTSNGISGKQVAVSLPRDTVVVRHLELPNVSDDELPDMVKLQAATQVTLPADKYLLDYIPLPPRGMETRDVLMTTVPTESTEAITKVLSGAGLEVASIGVSSFHIGELVVQQQDNKTRAANQLHLAVTTAGERVELALLRGKCVLATSATSIYTDGDAWLKAINAEVNRLRLSAQNLHGGLPVSHVWISPTGPEAEALCEHLKGKLNCEGSCFDPLGGSGDIAAEDRGQFAATAGHLFASQSSVTESVNYLAPRKAAKKQDRRKIMMALGGVGVALALGVGYLMFQKNLQEKDAEIARIKAEIADMQEIAREGKLDLATANKIDDWRVKSMDWIEQIEEINRLMPSREIMLVQQFVFSPGSENAKFRIQIVGLARAREDVTALTNALTEQGYKVASPSWPESNDDEYRRKFTIKADMPLDS